MAHSVIIWDTEDSSMGGGTWNEEIICTLRKDGTFSLRPRRRGDDFGTRSMAGTTRIRSPQVFVQALIDMLASFSYEIDPKDIVDEICPKLDELDLKFSQEIRAYIGTLDGKV